jgi:hypothetical protein
MALLRTRAGLGDTARTDGGITADDKLAAVRFNRRVIGHNPPVCVEYRRDVWHFYFDIAPVDAC